MPPNGASHSQPHFARIDMNISRTQFGKSVGAMCASLAVSAVIENGAATLTNAHVQDPTDY